jgi:hypothetical protein
MEGSQRFREQHFGIRFADRVRSISGEGACWQKAVQRGRTRRAPFIGIKLVDLIVAVLRLA